MISTCSTESKYTNLSYIYAYFCKQKALSPPVTPLFPYGERKKLSGVIPNAYCGMPGTPCLSKTGQMLACIFKFEVVCQYSIVY